MPKLLINILLIILDFINSIIVIYTFFLHTFVDIPCFYSESSYMHFKLLIIILEIHIYFIFPAGPLVS